MINQQGVVISTNGRNPKIPRYARNGIRVCVGWVECSDTQQKYATITSGDGYRYAPHILRVLFGVLTKVFNQAIKRNLDRFPADFMFQLAESEYEFLRSQIVTSNAGRGGRCYLPYAFTEHGAIMAATGKSRPIGFTADIEIKNDGGDNA